MAKTCKIVAIFMKNRETPHELARSALQFLKIAINILEESHLKTEGKVAALMIDSLFEHKLNHHVKKHKLLVRKLLTRLIRRCGIPFIT